jgi:predicted esterase
VSIAARRGHPLCDARDAAARQGGAIVNAVMVLHGTGGSGKQFLQPQFAQELYGPGQPLDLTAITSSCPTASATANRRSRATA